MSNAYIDAFHHAVKDLSMLYCTKAKQKKSSQNPSTYPKSETAPHAYKTPLDLLANSTPKIGI